MTFEEAIQAEIKLASELATAIYEEHGDLHIAMECEGAIEAMTNILNAWPSYQGDFKGLFWDLCEDQDTARWRYERTKDPHAYGMGKGYAFCIDQIPLEEVL